MATPQVIDDILQRAEAHYQQKDFVAASQLLTDAISEAPSARLWNDWAAVQVSLGHLQDAEGGFRVALQLDPASTQAAENLGALLFARGCHAEAAPLLQQVLAGASAQTRPVIEQILARFEAEGIRPSPTQSWRPFPTRKRLRSRLLKRRGAGTVRSPTKIGLAPYSPGCAGARSPRRVQLERRHRMGSPCP